MLKVKLLIYIPFIFIACSKQSNENQHTNKPTVETSERVYTNSLQRFTPTRSDPLYQEFISIVQKNAFFKKEYYDESDFKSYTYLDCYIIVIQTEKAPIFNYYCPDSVKIDNLKEYFEKFPKITIEVTKRYLEHILFSGELNPSIIISDWNDLPLLKYSYINEDWLVEHKIELEKPHTIIFPQYEKHIVYVFERPQEGGTIYKYEIKVQGNKFTSDFEKHKIYCFGDKWGYK
jgi:hypothetical protein